MVTRSWPPQIPALPENRRRPLLLSRAHLQAGPCQHKRRALPESAPLVLDKMPSPGTLEGTPLLLELQKLSGLANTDLSALNPNIQATIEVVAEPQAELEMDPMAEPNNRWSEGAPRWLPTEELLQPLFWGCSDEDSEGEDQEEDSEEHGEDDQEPGFSGAAGGWEQGPLFPGDWAFEEPDHYVPVFPGLSASGGVEPLVSLQWELRQLQPAEDSASPVPVTCPLPCLASSLPHGTEDKDPLGLPSEGWQPLAHDAMDMLSPNMGSGEKWLNCKSDFLAKYLSQVLRALPSCPCAYPLEAVSSAVSLRDEHQGRSFRRSDARPQEHLDVYRPTAHSACAFCSTPAAQHCCYDAGSQLLTRGKGAGAPDLVSTNVLPELHFKVDTLLWIPCKADCSRYHAVWTPNNGRACADNPPEEEYLAQLQEAKEY
ncbi:LOW QUALITY PROTEIN: isthmin-2 [Dama dama]